MSSGHLSNETILTDALNRSKQLTASNGHTQKRSLSSPDDLNFHSAKRPHSGSDMASMALGGQMTADGLTETIEIPDHAVGLVIGRGGEQINVIQQQSGCRVQMAPETSPNGFRQCTLQGPKHCIDRARQLVSEVIERSRGNNPNNSMMAMTKQQNGSQAGVITTELMVPGQKCGLIIGKNGETIKGIQEQLGVKMLLVQDSHQVTAGPKPLRITGTIEKVEQAKRHIELLLSAEDSNQLSQFRSTVVGPRSIGEVIVPRSSVGIIIGKAGETIKRLAAETGAKIQFKPDEDPNAQERCAVIQGTPEQINRATQMISELVQRSVGGVGQQEVFYMHVPANKTGLVIGKGGDTIKQICAESGAHVELSRDPPPNPNEKVFVIKGTGYQIHHAQHIIRIKVGDVAPGTPVPPFHGGISAITTSNPYGPSSHQYGGSTESQPGMFGAPSQWPSQNGFVAQNTGATQDPSAWTQYYSQQQAGYATAQPGFPTPAGQHFQGVQGIGVQQQLHQAQSQAIPQQAGAAALMAGQTQQQPQQQQLGAATGVSAINPQTGQPDYSAQWAEYYRTMGMHEQAALIEQQMKQNAMATQQSGRVFMQ